MANNITEQIKLPSQERLILLITNGAGDVAQQLIDTYKLPYVIKDGKLCDSVVGAERWLNRFITVDPDTIGMKEDAKKMSKCPDEVLVFGETGTGKEIIARAMIGDRQEQDSSVRFMSVNCAGIPDTLIESTLFGYVKGAFTGADSTRDGLMSKARDGVLFLDEIGELPMSVQGKLLRALQEKIVVKVGGDKEEPVNCKFVCATNKNLREMVKVGQFRQDLYARISTFELMIKPLRDRRNDIMPIIQSMNGGAAFLSALSDSGNSVLTLETPLNVRSLQQYVKRYNVLGRVILSNVV